MNLVCNNSYGFAQKLANINPAYNRILTFVETLIQEVHCSLLTGKLCMSKIPYWYFFSHLGAGEYTSVYTYPSRIIIFLKSCKTLLYPLRTSYTFLNPFNPNLDLFEMVRSWLYSVLLILIGVLDPWNQVTEEYFQKISNNIFRI